MNQVETALENAGVSRPFSMEAEQAVIGAAILDRSSVSMIIEQVREDYFYSKINRGIFNEIRNLFMKNVPTDYITMVNAVLVAGIFDNENTAKVYLAQVAELVPSLSNIPYYIGILKDKYLKRSRQNVAIDILRNSAEDADVDFLLESAEQKIYELRQGKETVGLTPIAQAAAESFDRLRKLSGEDREKYLGIPTGYRYLDRKLGRMGKSDLIILAARPGMGKSSFALNIATNVAGSQKIPVAVFSLEMSKQQLSDRLISSYGGVSSQQLRNGTVEDWDSIMFAINRISSMPIYLDDTANVTVGDIKAKVRRLNQNPEKQNVGLIVIDYIQLMKSARRNDNRVQEMSEITRELKIMAKELDVPIVALSQLSRSAEKQAGKDARPQLSDLRDSGSIEQDADAVLFLYREAYYDKSENADQTSAECIVAKNRHGETGTIELVWDGAHTRFYDVEYGRDE